MPTGLKATSSPIQISGSANEPAAQAFGSTVIELTLNPLDNEVFVVTQINLDVDAPDLPGAKDQINITSASLSTTKRTAVGGINNSNVLASAQRYAGMAGNGTSSGVSCVVFDREDPTFVAQDLDYLGIVATNNMHLNIIQEGSATAVNPKTVRVRVYGYRATASASQYAALVQSELLSE